MRRRGSAGALAAAVAVAVAAVLSGCSGFGAITLRTCFPARLQVAPAIAAPGEVVTVSSGPADCDLGYEVGHAYTLSIVVPGHRSPATTVTVDTSGRFTATLTVPAGFPAGDAAIVVDGSPYDHCDDTRGSCAGYTAALTIR